MEPREDRKGKRPLEIRDTPIQKQRKSASQMKILEDAYFFNRYPSKEVKQKLVENTGLAYRQVEHWFADQRYKSQKKKYKNYNDALEENRMLMPSKLGSNTTLGSILSAFHALDDGLSSTTTTIRYKRLQPVQPSKAQKQPFLLKSLASEPITLKQQHQQLLQQHMMPFQAYEALLGQQDMETYNGTTCKRQQTVQLKATTSLLNSENYFTSSTSTGLIAKVKSVDIFHLNGGSRDIHEYQFFPEHTTIYSSESIGRDVRAMKNLHVFDLYEGSKVIHEFQFFPQQPSMLSEKSEIINEHH